MARLLAALQDWDTLNLTENSCLIAAFASYERAWAEEFGVEHDDFRLPGQDNIRRYLPVRELRIRLHPDDTPFDLFARVAAARAAGCRITVSSPAHLEWRALTRLQAATEDWAGAVEFVEESDAELAKVISGGQTDRVRYAAADRVPLEIRHAAAEANVFLADAPVLMEGRAELLRYVQEQSLSYDYHRYGNLGLRSGEARAEPK
jgi:RHH-type proline utilization regulon transcriptional repressor/proline dehydrogenase/delta 1-pyrroline-5-carboxylate dehydrogenase